jgi:hypothetical protein
MSRVVPILLFALVLTPAAALPPEVAPPPRPLGEPLELLPSEDPGLQLDLEATLPELKPEALVPGLTGLDDPPRPPKAAATPLLLTVRTGKTRERLLKDYGGTEKGEKAVAAGLAWLAKQQKPDGSWVFDGQSKAEVTAATGLTLLAFLGAGESHTGDGKYARGVKLGVNWLVKNVPVAGRDAGKFADTRDMYAQGIGTLALAEAYALSKDRALRAPAQAAVNYLQKAQAPNGSWGYGANQNGDTSVVGWQIQALHAARLGNDLVVDPRVVKKAVEFLDTVAAGERKEKYGYKDKAGAAAGTSLTAVGLWCRHSVDNWREDSPGMIAGVAGLMDRAPGGTTAKPRGAKPPLDLYFYYYATQVVFRFGGDEWRDWNEGPRGANGNRKGGMRDWLVELQNTKVGANQGSWDPDRAFIGMHCGRLGTTALCLLTLETYYRYPVAHKKKELDPEIRKLTESAKGR